MNKPRKRQLEKAINQIRKRVECKIELAFDNGYTNPEKCNIQKLLKDMTEAYKTETLTERYFFFQELYTGTYRYKIGRDISEVYFIDLNDEWHKVEKEIVNILEGEY